MSKAHIVMALVPLVSHITPFMVIAQHLAAQGYQVTLIAPNSFQKSIAAIGAKHVPMIGRENFDDVAFFKENTDRTRRMPPQNYTIARVIFHELMTPMHKTLQGVLTPESVVLYDPLCFGVLPGLLGTGLQPRGYISVGVIPISKHSVDAGPPFLAGTVFDNSAAGRERNEALNAADIERLRPIDKLVYHDLRILGAKETPLSPLDANYTLSNIHLQLCPPSLEYPHSDPPSGLRFTGGIPRRESHKTSTDLPSWWHEVTSTKKRIVAVSQGTIALDCTNLIIPTMEALSRTPDVLVVVALGKRGAVLPSDFAVPANARVADWIPFDDLLSHSDIFVTNGGYGSFQNAIARGVPLVVAPVAFADKRDIAARVEWSGTGINLGVGNATPENLLKAVTRILEEPRFKRRVLEIKAEIQTYDSMGIIAGAIDELALGQRARDSRVHVNGRSS